jgi:hypothetical protein
MRISRSGILWASLALLIVFVWLTQTPGPADPQPTMSLLFGLVLLAAVFVYGVAIVRMIVYCWRFFRGR